MISKSLFYLSILLPLTGTSLSALSPKGQDPSSLKTLERVGDFTEAFNKNKTTVRFLTILSPS